MKLFTQPKLNTSLTGLFVYIKYTPVLLSSVLQLYLGGGPEYFGFFFLGVFSGSSVCI